MAYSERREMEIPSQEFSFTDDGQLVVNSDRVTNALKEADADRASGQVSVTVTISVQI